MVTQAIGRGTRGTLEGRQGRGRSVSTSVCQGTDDLGGGGPSASFVLGDGGGRPLSPLHDLVDEAKRLRLLWRHEVVTLEGPRDRLLVLTRVRAVEAHL